MPQITIQGTIINFPDSGNSPNWAPALVEFAEAVESGLAAAVGSFDVPSQTFDIDAYNAGTAEIPNLEFDNTQVRSAIITISTYRTNTSPSTTVAEVTELSMVYNPGNSTNEKWEWSRERTGNASISFSVSDAGQVSFTTTSIGAGTHTGVLSYSAKALTQT